jgi:hypothetical protein
MTDHRSKRKFVDTPQERSRCLFTKHKPETNLLNEETEKLLRTVTHLAIKTIQAEPRICAKPSVYMYTDIDELCTTTRAICFLCLPRLSVYMYTDIDELSPAQQRHLFCVSSETVCAPEIVVLLQN